MGMLWIWLSFSNGIIIHFLWVDIMIRKYDTKSMCLLMRWKMKMKLPHWGHKLVTAMPREIYISFMYCKRCVLIKISLEFVFEDLIKNQPWLAQMMDRCQEAIGHYLNQWRPSLLTQICVTWHRKFNTEMQRIILVHTTLTEDYLMEKKRRKRITKNECIKSVAAERCGNNFKESRLMAWYR